MARNIIGNEARKKLEIVLLLNNAFHSRIAIVVLDILKQVISHRKATPLNISLQFS